MGRECSMACPPTARTGDRPDRGSGPDYRLGAARSVYRLTRHHSATPKRSRPPRSPVSRLTEAQDRLKTEENAAEQAEREAERAMREARRPKRG